MWLSVGAVTSHGFLFEILRALGLEPNKASSISSVLTRPVAALVILIIGILVGYLVKKGVSHAIRATVLVGPARERSRHRISTLADALGRLARGMIVLVAFILALGAMGINLIPFVAGATIIGAIVAFGAQNLIKDYLAGFLLVVEDQIAVGDEATVGNVTGKVERFTLRVTSIRDSEGVLWHFANGDIRVLGSIKRVGDS